jgi:hypothetical protein
VLTRLLLLSCADPLPGGHHEAGPDSAGRHDCQQHLQHQHRADQHGHRRLWRNAGGLPMDMRILHLISSQPQLSAGTTVVSDELIE